MQRIQLVLLCMCVTMLILVGCTAKGQEVILKDGDLDVRIASVREDAYSKDVVVSSGLKAGDKRYYFDTKEEKLTKYEEQTNQIEKYRTKSNGLGMLEVIDNTTNELVYEIDLKSQGFIEEEGEYNTETSLSPTERYLLVIQYRLMKSILIDLKDKKQIKIPINGLVRLDWANDDKQVILHHISFFGITGDNVTTYLWHFPGTEIEEFGKGFRKKLIWSPDGNHLYYITRKSIDGEVGYVVMLYNKEWNEVYFTRGIINENSLRWISDNAFILTVRAAIRTKNPIKSYFRPEEYFAIKVDYKKNKETIKKLDGILISSYVWSYDNQFVYYVDNERFYKKKVNFGE